MVQDANYPFAYSKYHGQAVEKKVRDTDATLVSFCGRNNIAITWFVCRDG